VVNPEVYIEGSSVRANGYTAVGSQIVNFALFDRAGVSTLEMHAISSDELHDIAVMEATITVDQVTMTGTFTTSADAGNGQAWIMQALVNRGLVTQAVYQFGVFVLAANGERITAVGQTYEGSLAFGWTPDLNTALRNDLPGEGVSVTPVPNTVLLRDSGGAGMLTSLYTAQTSLILDDGSGNVTVGDEGDTVALTVACSDALTLVSQGGNIFLNAASGNGVKTQINSQTVLTTSISSSGITTLLDASQAFSIFQGNNSQSWYFISGVVNFEATTITWYDFSIAKCVDWNLAGAGASNMTIAAGTTFSFTQAQTVGTGATASKTLTFTAQPGQAQSGANNNNVGGSIMLQTGAEGTGGSGTAGTPGAIQLKLGSHTMGQFSTAAWPDTRYTVDASASYFVFAANGTSQSLFFQTTGSGGATYFQTSTINFEDASLSLTMAWALAASGATSMTMAVGVTSFSIKQTNTSTAVVGAAMSFTAQTSSHASSTGGAVNITSGSGTSASGHVNIFVGGGGAGLVISDTSILMSCVGGDTIFSCDSSENITIGAGGTPTVILQGGSGSATLTIDSGGIELGSNNVVWSNAFAAPTIKQADLTTNSGTGHPLVLQAQNETGTTSTGGTFTTKSGTGTSHDGDWQAFVGAGSNKGLVMHGNGNINLYANDGPIVLTTSVALFTIGGSAPLLWGTTTISLATGTTTLSTAQQQTPMIVYSASLSGNVVVDFGNVAGNWEVDIRLVTLNAHTVSVKSGTTTVALPTATTTKNLFNIRTDGSNGISIG
jgi:hypothetical protein